jgi:hypothetical protein
MDSSLVPIQVPFRDDAMKLIAVHWSDRDVVRIEVASSRSKRGCVVEFDSVAGLRLLGELDLAATWIRADPEQLRASWLFKVTSNGWFALEASRNDFYLKHETPTPSEFLVAGYQECLSVLSHVEPKVRELR